MFNLLLGGAESFGSHGLLPEALCRCSGRVGRTLVRISLCHERVEGAHLIVAAMCTTHWSESRILHHDRLVGAVAVGTVLLVLRVCYLSMTTMRMQ